MSERPLPHTDPKGETYESNSKSSQGNVKARKKTLGKKMQDTFISEDVEHVENYILFDVIVPAVKDVIDDIVVKSLRMILYGDTNGQRKHKGSSTFISYDLYSKPNKKRTSNSDYIE